MVLCRISTARNVLLGLYFFFLGVEYAVILPTINDYLISLHAKQTFLGIVLASFSAAGMISAPIYGRISDKTNSARACIVVGNLFEIVGNVLYFMGINKYLIWVGRLVCGLGSGAAASIFGLISRTTTTKGRTGALAALMGLRQIGLLVGPGLNAFLYQLDFMIGPFAVNSNTSPGLFMAILWFIHTVLFIILFRNIPQTDASAVDPSSNNSNNVNAINSSTVNANDDEEIILNLQKKAPRSFYDEFIREEVIICIATSFLVMFSQTVIETALTPFTRKYFEWNGLDNSYLLGGAGIIVVISFAAVHFLSKKFQDRVLLLFGSILLMFAHALFTAFAIILYLHQELATPIWLLPIFCIECFLITTSLPFLFVPHVSLFSKITSEETQSFNQGVRLVALRFGQILGPLWASSMVSTSELPIMCAVCLLSMCLLTIMIAMSYKRLITPLALIRSNSFDINSEPQESTENSPLLVKHT